MKKKILLSLAALTALSFTACSNKIPDAEKVVWERNTALTINKEFILHKEYKVPKDPFLKNENWTYQIIAQKQGDNFFKNTEIVKMFFIAHNSQEIVLIGREDLIKEYKKYFLDNQVTGNINLQVINPLEKDFEKVNILFFNGIKS